MNPSNIKLSEISPEKLVCNKKPEPREAKNNPGLKVQRAFLQYNFGTDKTPEYKAPYFELEITSAIIRKKEQQGKQDFEWSLLVFLNQSDMKGGENLNKGVFNIVEKYKIPFGLGPQFTVNNITSNTCRSIAFQQMDQTTGMPLSGTDMLIMPKMDKTSSITVIKDYNPKTKQYKLEPIDYTLLEGKKVTASIIIHVRDIFKGTGCIYPQVFVKSAMILDVGDQEVDHTKSEYLNSYNDTTNINFELLSEKIDQIKNKRDISLLSTNPQHGGYPSTTMSQPPIPQFPINPNGGIDLTQHLNNGPITLQRI